jgi:hypothetical protein
MSIHINKPEHLEGFIEQIAKQAMAGSAAIAASIWM